MDEMPLPTPAPSEFAPFAIPEKLGGDWFVIRQNLPRWEAQLAEIKRLFAERYPVS